MALVNSASPQASPVMSTPWLSMMMPIVSRISLSTPTWPFGDGSHRSETLLRPFDGFSLFQASPAKPDLPRHRRACGPCRSRGACRLALRFADAFGIADLSRACVKPD